MTLTLVLLLAGSIMLAALALIGYGAWKGIFRDDAPPIEKDRP